MFSETKPMKKTEAHPKRISGRLATYLTEQKDAIIKEWVAQVRKDSAVPTDTMATLEIGGHVPPIFDAIIQSLRQHRTDAAMEQIRETTATHIVTRWQQHYNLPAVLREVSLLRTIFIYHLRMFEELHPDFGVAARFFASATINSMLDKVVMDATDQFLKLTREPTGLTAKRRKEIARKAAQRRSRPGAIRLRRVSDTGTG